MLTRRNLLLSAATLPAATALEAATRASPPTAASGSAPLSTATTAAVAPPVTLPAAASATTFPDKASFAATDTTYLDSGSYHPISLGARSAIEKYLARRTLEPSAQGSGVEEEDVLA